MKPLEKNKIAEVEAIINAAVAENQKPSEDVVPFTVCSNATRAARMLLEDFLIRNNVKFAPGSGFADLLTLCKKQDRTFKNFDTHAFECQAHGENSANYCLDINRANQCLELTLDLSHYIRSRSVDNVEDELFA